MEEASRSGHMVPKNGCTCGTVCDESDALHKYKAISEGHRNASRKQHLPMRLAQTHHEDPKQLNGTLNHEGELDEA